MFVRIKKTTKTFKPSGSNVKESEYVHQEENCKLNLWEKVFGDQASEEDENFVVSGTEEQNKIFLSNCLISANRISWFERRRILSRYQERVYHDFGRSSYNEWFHS